MVKSLYDKLNETGVDIVSLNLPDSFWIALWKLDISQRIKLFLWKCLQNSLSTNSKLFGKVNDVDPYYTMCGTEIETTENLLLHCPYAKEIWNSSPNPITLNINISSTFLELCKDWIKNPRKQISLELILTKMWFIWKEKYNRVFENKATTVKNLAMEIQGHVAFWAQRSNLQNKAIYLKKNTLKPLWQAPSKYTLKINVYAAWISDSLPFSYALILRDDTGISGGGKAGQSTTTDLQEAEALGMM
ncbi:uncharacterized protein LOC113346223 [Papaver somniferum]|uniref:uncharacterized protein LOC113346223 n=1 Tax=Papaver somniferum TaxID=3469 RepID=UPI000E6F5510|nr:uncharacterized protein LOC113346223 [Papaver somniferum]